MQKNVRNICKLKIKIFNIRKNGGQRMRVGKRQKNVFLRA